MLHCELVYGTSFSSVSVCCLQNVLDHSQARAHTHAILFLNLALPVRIANLKLLIGHHNVTSQGGFIEMSQHTFRSFEVVLCLPV